MIITARFAQPHSPSNKLYTHRTRNLRLACMQQVGFPLRDPNRLQLALDHSHSVLWIRSMKQSRWARQGQLLGFARATSDGALSATIWDVAVSLSPQCISSHLCFVNYNYCTSPQSRCGPSCTTASQAMLAKPFGL